MEEIKFSDLPLHQDLISALENIGLIHPTKIQEMTMDHLLNKEDIFALAETGSGKTGAFCIPIINNILNGSTGLHVILSPTRELAQQTDKVIKQITENLEINSVCIIGGESIVKQTEILDQKPNFIVATPGRLLDVIKNTSLDLSKVETVVFDEVDRLFDMGFKKDIEYILKDIPDSRQFIMVSATTNFEVMSMAYKFKSHPLEIKLSPETILVDNIDDKVAMIDGDEKMPFLVNILKNHIDTYAIIFTNTQYQTHLLAQWLCDMGFKAKAISGRLPQNQRTKLMQEFHDKEVTILVCTDVAARGLDIKDINLVINFDLPMDAANYVHRIGRTGRAGKKGEAISFCSFEDCQALEGITNLIGKSIPKMDITDESFYKEMTAKPFIDPKTLKTFTEEEYVEYKKTKREEKYKKTKDTAKREHKKNNKQPSNYVPVKTQLNFNEISARSLDAENNDKKVFIKTHLDTISLRKDALEYFNLLDGSLLEYQILKKGMKKFFFFGPRKVTTKVTVRPIFKKLLTPLLEDLIKLIGLKINVNVSFKNNIYINFDGQDTSLIEKNDGELARSFEQICWSYLITKIDLSKNIKIIAKTHETTHGKHANNREQNKNNDRSNKNGNNRSRNDHHKKNNTNQYRDEDFEKILSEAKKIKQQVIESKGPILMRPLNAAERRQVHELFSDDDIVKTNSIGEGRLKQIEISLR